MTSNERLSPSGVTTQETNVETPQEAIITSEGLTQKLLHFKDAISEVMKLKPELYKNPVEKDINDNEGFLRFRVIARMYDNEPNVSIYGFSGTTGGATIEITPLGEPKLPKYLSPVGLVGFHDSLPRLEEFLKEKFPGISI